MTVPPPFDLDAAHRWFATELNNRAWDALDAAGAGAPPDEVVHAAHAACHHWLRVGTAIHHARAECLVANVYAALGRGASALRHARRCLELTEANIEQAADWDLAFARDCLARAHAAAGDGEKACRLRKQAREAGDAIAGVADRRVFDRWFAAGRWHGVDV